MIREKIGEHVISNVQSAYESVNRAAGMQIIVWALPPQVKELTEMSAAAVFGPAEAQA